MKHLVLICSLAISQWCQAQNFENKLAPFYYLVGEYDIKVFTPDESGTWKRDGSGVSTYTLLFDSTYIDEMFTLNMSSSTLTMRSTLGVDGRSKELRLIAMMCMQGPLTGIR